MNRYCVEKWFENKTYLKTALLNYPDLDTIDYTELMRLCVKHILNAGSSEGLRYEEDIACIYIGRYQGSILFVIKEDGALGVDDVLLSYVEYGSCTYCDTLQHILCESKDSMELVNDLMYLCKDLVCNIVKPYNDGWRNRPEFDVIQGLAD
ncbi:MAG: hypothetical protein J6A75_02315 [Lachnospiraceae bacterium]|nr:hypothetical protein [Lachnospiraceae bacterium]